MRWPSTSRRSRLTARPWPSSASTRTTCSASGTGWVAATRRGRPSARRSRSPSAGRTSKPFSPARTPWTSTSSPRPMRRTCQSSSPCSASGAAAPWEIVGDRARGHADAARSARPDQRPRRLGPRLRALERPAPGAAPKASGGRARSARAAAKTRKRAVRPPPLLRGQPRPGPPAAQVWQLLRRRVARNPAVRPVHAPLPSLLPAGRHGVQWQARHPRRQARRLLDGARRPHPLESQALAGRASARAPPLTPPPCGWHVLLTAARLSGASRAPTASTPSTS